MKDIFRNELEIGDTVAFMEPGYTYTLQTGTIVKFTPKKLVIEWDEFTTDPIHQKQSYKFPCQVVKGDKHENR